MSKENPPVEETETAFDMFRPAQPTHMQPGFHGQVPYGHGQYGHYTPYGHYGHYGQYGGYPGGYHSFGFQPYQQGYYPWMLHQPWHQPHHYYPTHGQHVPYGHPQHRE
jgi:hypothetical protein